MRRKLLQPSKATLRSLIAVVEAYDSNADYFNRKDDEINAKIDTAFYGATERHCKACGSHAIYFASSYVGSADNAFRFIEELGLELRAMSAHHGVVSTTIHDIAADKATDGVGKCPPTAILSAGLRAVMARAVAA